jgi:hypothetical protein
MTLALSILGVMGQNLGLNMGSKGFSVAEGAEGGRKGSARTAPFAGVRKEHRALQTGAFVAGHPKRGSYQVLHSPDPPERWLQTGRSASPIFPM